MTEADDRDADGRSDADQSDDRRTMADVSHTNPYTNETFGGIYRRGPAVADGGAAPTPVTDDGAEATSVASDDDAEATSVASDDDGSADAESADRPSTMGEIDHTPRDLNVNSVWDRGDCSFVPGDD